MTQGAMGSLLCTRPPSMRVPVSNIPGKVRVSLAVLVPCDHAFLATADWTLGDHLTLGGPVGCLVLYFRFMALRI